MWKHKLWKYKGLYKYKRSPLIFFYSSPSLFGVEHWKKWSFLPSFSFKWNIIFLLHCFRTHCAPLQYSCLENPMDGGVWWAAVHGVARSRTRLKWLSLAVHFLRTHLTIYLTYLFFFGFSGGAVAKNSPANAGEASDCKFNPWVGKIPWRRKW